MRIRGAKTEMEELGEDTTGMAESTAKLQAEIKALSGIDIMLDKDNFKSTYQIMDELSAKWEDLSDIAQASIIELMAGKHQGNVFASLMQNFDIARDALTVSAESAGSAMEEHEKWSQSLEAGLNRLKAAWQSLSQTFMDSNLLKGGIDLLTGFIDIIDKLIDNLGLLGTVGAGIVGKGIFKYFKDFKNVSGIGEMAGTILEVADSVNDITDSLSNASKTIEVSAKAFDGLEDVTDIMNNISDVTYETLDTFDGFAEIGDTIGDFSEYAYEASDSIVDVADTASDATGVIDDLGDAVKKTNGGFKAFMKTPLGVASAIGAVIAVIGLAVSAFKNYKQAQADARQETIDSSNEFLDSASTFEQAYIKYSGRTSLTSEEESELASAIDGTVSALGDKSSALQNVVDNSNDYLSSLEAIAREELKASQRKAQDKLDAAEESLDEVAKGWFEADGSEVNVKIATGVTADSQEVAKVAKEIGKEYYDTLNISGSGASSTVGFRLDADADINEIVDYYNMLVDYKDRLRELELDDTSAFDNVTKAIDSMSGAVETYIDALYDASKLEYEYTQNNGIPKTAEEYIKMRESILKTLNEDDASFDVRNNIANSLDAEYGQLFDLSSIEIQARKFKDIIKGFGDGTVDGTNEIGTVETFLNMRTAVNNGECSVGEYLSSLEEVRTMADGFSDEEKEAFNLAFNIDTDSLEKQYDALVEDYTRVNGEDSKSKIQEFLNSLTKEELTAFYSIKTEIDWKDDSLEDIRNQIEENVKIQEALSFTIDLKLEKEKLDSISTALSESVSGSGLSTESMSAIGDIFKELDNYDPSKLFERTANGMRLNTDEFRKLNEEYKNINIDGLEKKMSTLGDEYNRTREELSNLAYGTDEYNTKLGELEDIESAIKDLEQLASGYEGLASAYQTWQMAESAGSQRDMYESMISGLENIDDEISRGWLDDGTIEFLRLIKGDTLSATASTEELKKAYESLDDTIKHTTYSVRDFFTVDEDGNSTNTGVYNFLDAIGQMEEEKFGGKDVVQRDKNGNIIGFDFQIVGGDKAIADALGISEELVQIMVRAADDAGFVVSMDGTYQQLDVLKEKAQNAANELKNTFKKTEFEFDLDTSSEESIGKQYQEALKIWEGFKKNKNKDGTVNMEVEGAEEAFTLVSTLQSMVDKLSEPVYMELDASHVEKDMQTPLSKLQEYERLVQQENQLKLKGTDTTEIDNAQEEILNYFENLQENSPEIAAELGIKGLTREEIQAKVEAGEIEIPATIDLQVEMNNTLRDMVNVALYNAGIIDKEEFEKRVDVKVYADTVDTKDVEEKTEEAVNNEDGETTTVNKQVEVNYQELVNLVDKYTTGEQEIVFKFLADPSEVEDYSIKDKELIVKFLSDTVEIDGYTPEEKETYVRYLVNGGDIENYTPEQKEAIVEYLTNSDEPNNYTPEQKEAIVEYLTDSGDPDNYTPEQKEAIAKFIKDSGEVDNWTPEQKEAVAKFIKNSADVDNYTPEQKEAIAKFIKNSIDPDTYVPENKEAIAKFIKDSLEPDTYTPPNPTGTVTFEKDSSDVDSYDPPNFTRYVDYIKRGISNAAEMGESRKNERFSGSSRNYGSVNGTANVNGTAFADGTINKSGRAFKQGNWGTKNSGIALGGELGQETIVRNGRFFTIGNNGAEFFQYKKGDIIFNHKQTEELFKNGKVTSGGGRGKAFVEGTAFVGGSQGTDGIGKVKGTSVKKETTTTKSTTTTTASGSPKTTNSNSKSDSKTSSSSDTEDEFEETLDLIEIAIDRIERAIDKLDLKVNSVYKTWSTRNSNLVKEISKVEDEIKLQQKAAQRYLDEANSVGLPSSWATKVRKGEVDIETITDEDLADKIGQYQDWYEKYLDCIDAAEELKETEAELYAQRFENVQSQYDAIIQGYEHTETMLNEYISQAEEQGFIVSKKYYQALASNEKLNIAQLKKEQADLIAKRDEAVASGTIKKGSEEWYNMCASVDEVTQAIEEGTTALLEYDNAMREIDWGVFDLIQDRISAVSEEADFLIELMSNDKLYNDNGQLTNQGMATMALHGQNYNSYMYQSDDYDAEISKLNKQIAKDPYDQELVNRRNELIELQRESILAAEDEKEAIRDMVEEGINLELDALQERIDLYNEAMDSAKDLYDYQKKVEEQTSEIADLEKQLSAYSGDNSEEANAKLQEIEVSLKEAKSDLEETEYDKYIDDQAKLLDSLYLEYETILNTRLDNIDYLLEQMIAEINAAASPEGTIATALGEDGSIAKALGTNATTIKTTLETEAGKVGATLSTAMSNIWTVGDGNIKSVITMYGKGFQDKQTSTNAVLDKIKADVNAMVDDIDKDAQKKVAAKKTATSAKKNPTTSTTTNKKNNTTNKKTTSSGDGKPKVGDKVKFISGQYYYDSQGKKPLGSKYQGKEVYITNINTKNWATHPYHISTGKKLGSGDLGWLKLNQISGYATGKKNFASDEIAWTQEKNAQEYIIRPSDGAILTPIARGDSVLNANASSNLWDMANAPSEFIKENLNLGTANVPNNSNVHNTYTQNLENVVFSLPNVQNYDELLSAMQKDKNFERLILSMSIDRIAGKSSLAKNKVIR